MRGFFGGLIIGLVTISIAIVGLSLLSPVSQKTPQVSYGAPQPATGTGTGTDQTGTDQPDIGTDVAASGRDNDLVELAPTAPGGQLGAQSGAQSGTQPGGQDDLSSLQSGDTDPAARPRVGGATLDLADPDTSPRAPEIDVDGDAPVAPPAPGAAPSAPQGETRPAAVNDPAQPLLPEVAQGGASLFDDPVTDETAPVDASPEPVPVPDAETGTEATPASPPAVTVAPQGEDAEAGTAPVAELDQVAPQEPAAPAGADESSAPQIAALPQAGSDADVSSPGIGKPVVPLTQRASQSDPQAPDTDTGSDPAADAEDQVTGPPIDLFGAAFENPENLPLMAIVLIDDDQGLGAEALAEFPYPLSFAVDPSDPGAADKMARHRAAGFEVVALVDLPTDATARDAEVNLSVWLDTLPEVVALLEGTGSGIQGSRELSDQVTAIVAGNGLGLIMQTRGLNTAHKLAARDGVPAGLVFRDFDGAGQKPVVIRRFLDQAAFRAGQQGGVIMLGRLRPDTISALLLWGLQDRASRVALAPVSAVLKRGAK